MLLKRKIRQRSVRNTQKYCSYFKFDLSSRNLWVRAEIRIRLQFK
jgi:hypothetical protein